MKSLIRLMEYVWLTLAFLCLVVFVDAMIRFGWYKAKIFLLLTALSLIMYLWRRQVRKQQESEANDND